ncbi:Hypothetical protein AA314_05703 [Archangium gephyra]|uniref:Uncharacterized protein n=1 Tax=Archangium gephyra TaxID=48 RepID=A0AAC8TFH2_9BACT|nr:Hypothetical protein AA314_05703 [Archangium gephyra]
MITAMRTPMLMSVERAREDRAGVEDSCCLAMGVLGLLRGC